MIHLPYRSSFLDKIAVLQKGFFPDVKTVLCCLPRMIISWAKKASVWVRGARHTLLLAVFAKGLALTFLSDSLPPAVAFAILTFACERYSGSFAGILHLRQFHNGL